MRLEWQDRQNTAFPYLWCHGCALPLDGGLSIAGSTANDKDWWMRLCPKCLDEINTYMIDIIRREQGYD